MITRMKDKELTDGCNVTIANTTTKIKVITMKKVFIPQSCPEAVKK